MMLSEYAKSNMVVQYNDLQQITGYSKPTEVAACLRNNGVKYILGKHGRPWTTLGAIELAMGATAIQVEFEKTEKPRKVEI